MQVIPLSQGLFALVDDEDYERLNQWKWYAVRDGRIFYAARNSSRPNRYRILMHHEVIGKPPSGFQTDHINGDGLNNQRGNLRLVTNSQNQQNRHRASGRSHFKGVCWHPVRSKWQSQIKIDGRNTYLGLFISEEEAARAYDAAALENYGEFARLNFEVTP